MVTRHTGPFVPLSKLTQLTQVSLIPALWTQPESAVRCGFLWVYWREEPGYGSGATALVMHSITHLCYKKASLVQFMSVQLLSHVQLFAAPWTASRQTSLSVTNSRSSLKLISIESVMSSNHLIFCRPLLLPPSILPSIRVFSNESALSTRWQSIGASASTSILPMNTQDWSPIGWTGLISLQTKGLSRVFSNITVQKHQFFSAQLSL